MALQSSNQSDDPLTQDSTKFVQFEPCTYNNGQPFLECKYIDNYKRCIFEDCIWDQKETPLLTPTWWFTCLICHKPDTIDPHEMKAHFCKSCIDRINDAEVLPFTCRFCGKQQSHPSQWMFSKICDSCMEKLTQMVNQWPGHY